MPDVSGVPKEKLEFTLREIRRDIARLHRDLALGAGNEVRWFFILMWIVLSNLLISAFNLSAMVAVGGAAFLVMTYGVIDGIRIRRSALQTLNEPVEPMWNTEVKL